MTCRDWPWPRRVPAQTLALMGGAQSPVASVISCYLTPGQVIRRQVIIRSAHLDQTNLLILSESSKIVAVKCLSSQTRILHSRDVDENKTESDWSESFTHAESITEHHELSDVCQCVSLLWVTVSAWSNLSKYVSFSVKKTNQQVKKLKQVLAFLFHFSITNTYLPCLFVVLSLTRDRRQRPVIPDSWYWWPFYVLI